MGFLGWSTCHRGTEGIVSDVDSPDVQVPVTYPQWARMAYLVSATGVTAQVLLAGCPMTWPVLCPTEKKAFLFQREQRIEQLTANFGRGQRAI